MTTAGGLVVEINGEDFAADYGLLRPDVARLFGDRSLRAVGYSLLLPAGSTPSAPVLTLKIMIFSGDGSRYYESGPMELMQ